MQVQHHPVLLAMIITVNLDYLQDKIGYMFYIPVIHCGMDNNVMEMKDHVALTLRCHGL